MPLGSELRRRERAKCIKTAFIVVAVAFFLGFLVGRCSAMENIEYEVLLCPNPVMNYMNNYQDYQRCYRIFLPKDSKIVSVKKLRGETHFSPGFPSDEAVDVVYEREVEGKKVAISRVYVYGLESPSSWNEREPV